MLVILDVEALVNIDKVTKFHVQVVTDHFVHLDSAISISLELRPIRTVSHHLLPS